MADKIADALDRRLESLLREDAIADDGFSKRVVARIRRRIWVNRLALPIAVAVGFAFAVKPVLDLVQALLPLFSVLPTEMFSASLQYLPQLQLVVLGGMMLAGLMILVHFIEET